MRISFSPLLDALGKSYECVCARAVHIACAYACVCFRIMMPMRVCVFVCVCVYVVRDCCSLLNVTFECALSLRCFK